MDKFQVQSQWENESQSPNSYLENQRKTTSLQVTKRSVIIVVVVTFIVICAMFSVYTFGRRIEGVWVRQVDDNSTLAGMTVEVRKNNGILEGKIIAMPDGAETFEVGQVKWFALEKRSFGVYQGSDLSSNNGAYYYDDTFSLFSIKSGGNTLTVQNQGQDVSLGKFQVWVKQK